MPSTTHNLYYAIYDTCKEIIRQALLGFLSISTMVGLDPRLMQSYSPERPKKKQVDEYESPVFSRPTASAFDDSDEDTNPNLRPGNDSDDGEDDAFYPETALSNLNILKRRNHQPEEQGDGLMLGKAPITIEFDPRNRHISWFRKCCYKASVRCSTFTLAAIVLLLLIGISLGYFLSSPRASGDNSFSRQEPETSPVPNHFPTRAPENIDFSDLFVPHLPFQGDLHFRRVCAPVHTSTVLCLTIRFPFAVPLQNATVHYPKPVDERIADLKQEAFLDGEDLQKCMDRQGSQRLTTDQAVRECLETVAYSQDRPTVVSVWTRRRPYEDFQFFGVRVVPVGQSTEPREAIAKAFDSQTVLIVGGVSSGDVTLCLLKMFGMDCRKAGLPTISRICHFTFRKAQRQRHGRNLNDKVTYNSVPDDGTLFAAHSYTPNTHDKGKTRLLPPHNLTQDLVSIQRTGFKSLRKLSLIINYPMSDLISQNMVSDSWGDLVHFQTAFPPMLNHVRTTEGRAELAQLGYQLEHFIVMDGIPQFYPTDTGAYDIGFHGISTREDFSPFPGWIPDYGNTCRGPIPDTSPQTELAVLGRSQFDASKWYGQTWEFANVFWWQMRAWGMGHGLDCTRSSYHSGASCVQTYFLAAMVEAPLVV